MKRFFCGVLALLTWLCCLSWAWGEEENSGEIELYGVTFSLDAEKIDFGAVEITDVQPLIDALPLFTNLKEVDVYESPFGRDEWAALYEANPEIHWGFTLKVASHYFRTDTEVFSSLHNPGSSTRYGSDFYEILKYCWNLKALDLGHNKLTDISFIGGMTELRALILNDNQVSDLSPLANCTHLQYVEIPKNKFTDISPLANCKELLDLNVSFVNTLHGVDEVLGLPKLERLWISTNSHMSREYINGIVAQLPDTVTVCINPAHNVAGWRDHPRYFVTYEMYKTFTYIPFEEASEE